MKHFEAMFNALVELSPIGVGFAKDGVTVQVNRVYLDMFGYTDLSEVSGLHVLDMIAPAYREIMATRIASRAKGLEIESTYQTRGLRKDGSDFPLLISAKRVETSEGPLTLAFFTNLTEQQRAETMLKSRDEHFQALFERASEGILIISSGGKIVAANEAYARMLGYTSQEMRCLELHDLDTEEGRRQIPERMQHIFAGERLVFEVENRHKHGHLIPVEVSASMIVINGEAFVQSFARDVTERKQSELLLLQHQAAVQTSHDGYWLISEQGILLDVNRAYTEISGYSRDELVGKHLSEFSGIDRSVGEVSQHISNIKARGWDVFETYHRCKDGKEVPFEVSATYIPQSGQFIGFFRDITERKRTEAELRIAATAFESQESLLVTDANGSILRVNPAFTECTGYTSQEVVGKTPSILKSGRHDAEFYRAMWQSINQTGKWQGEVWDKRKNGVIYPKLLSITAVKDSDGVVTHYVGSHTDITERKKLDDKLSTTTAELMRSNAYLEEERALLTRRVAERTAQLQQLNNAKDSFLATMSHEIRTPLGGLMGMMELLDHSQLDAQQHEQLNSARESAGNLLRIVNDILDWSKIEAGKLELAPRPSSIDALIQGVCNSYQSVASCKGIILHCHCDELLGSTHLFDRLRIAQILNNFTSNAIKFTNHGRVSILAEQISRHNDRETVRFCVKDDGIGISPEQQTRVFQQYEQASNDTARMYGGTGLGLAICQKLAELMGGSLNMESEPGVGSTFYFTVDLPMVESESLDSQLTSEKSTVETNESRIRQLANSRQINVLFVDDHPVNRMMLKQQLVLLGLQADAAADGNEAISKWSNGRYDLIITDCHMPEMDGYELTRTIRELECSSGSPRMPIIAWTANVMAEEAEHCKTAGMDDILTKPTELSELSAKLLKWLQGKCNSENEEPTDS